MTKEEWFWIVNIKGLGPKKRQALAEFYGSYDRILTAKEKELGMIPLLTKEDRFNILNKQGREDSKKEYDKLARSGICFVTREDREYPEKLKNIYQPPDALYYKGKLPAQEKKSIAVIGARNCSYYGKHTAEFFSEQLSKMGFDIISGLAKGIDSAGHTGALRAEGQTFGILGCGITECYPKENLSLYENVSIHGGILSEYGPGIPPLPCYFPMRNRIISGLSDGILVVEAKERSGSLITADFGLDQGKEIYAVPGRIDDRLSTGCNRLIQMGAKPVIKPEDIAEDFKIGYGIKSKNSKKINYLLETKEKIVYASLSLEPRHIEQIAAETKYSLQEVMSLLVSLEIKDMIKQIGKNYFVIK